MITLKLKDATFINTYEPQSNLPTIIIKQKIPKEDFTTVLAGPMTDLFESLNAMLLAKETNSAPDDARMKKKTAVSLTTAKGNLSKDYKAFVDVLMEDDLDLEIAFMIQLTPKTNKSGKAVTSATGSVTIDNSQFLPCPLIPSYIAQFNRLMQNAGASDEYQVSPTAYWSLVLSDDDSPLRRALYNRSLKYFQKRTQGKLDKIVNLSTSDEYFDAAKARDAALEGFTTDDSEVQKAFEKFIQTISNTIKQLETPKEDDIRALIDIINNNADKETFNDIGTYGSRYGRKTFIGNIINKENIGTITENEEVQKLYTKLLDDALLLQNDKRLEAAIRLFDLYDDDELGQYSGQDVNKLNNFVRDGLVRALQNLANQKRYSTVESLKYYGSITRFYTSETYSDNKEFNDAICKEIKALCDNNYINTLYDFVLFISTNLSAVKNIFLNAATSYIDAVKAKYSDMAIIRSIAPDAAKLTDEDFKESKARDIDLLTRRKALDIYHVMIAYYARALDNKIKHIAEIYLKQYNAPSAALIKQLNAEVGEIDTKLQQNAAEQEQRFTAAREKTFDAFKERFKESKNRDQINDDFAKMVDTLNNIQSEQDTFQVATIPNAFTDMAVGNINTLLIPEPDNWETSVVEAMCYNFVQVVTLPLIKSHYLIQMLNTIQACTSELKQDLIAFNNAYYHIAQLYNELVRYYGFTSEQIVRLNINKLTTASTETIKNYVERHGGLVGKDPNGPLPSAQDKPVDEVREEQAAEVLQESLEHINPTRNNEEAELEKANADIESANLELPDVPTDAEVENMGRNVNREERAEGTRFDIPQDRIEDPSDLDIWSFSEPTDD